MESSEKTSNKANIHYSISRKDEVYTDRTGLGSYWGDTRLKKPTEDIYDEENARCEALVKIIEQRNLQSKDIISNEDIIDDVGVSMEADTDSRKVVADNYQSIIENCPVKVLTSVPKKKTTFLDVYVNAFALLMFVTSLFFMDGLVYDFIDFFNVPKGIISAIMHYGYYLFHIFSFGVMIVHANRLNNTKK